MHVGLREPSIDLIDRLGMVTSVDAYYIATLAGCARGRELEALRAVRKDIRTTVSVLILQPSRAQLCP